MHCNLPGKWPIVNSSTTRARSRTALCAGLCVVLAGACGACTVAPEPPPPVQQAPAKPPPPPIDYRRINALLDAGLYAMDEDRLITPIDHSAYDYFRKVLMLVPDEPRALLGLERIVERYLELAERAIARGQWASARTMLARARIVKPEHSGIDLVESRLALFSVARRERVSIDATALAERSPALREELNRVGRRAKRPNVQVTITTRTDEDGRWVYQQLRDAPGDARVRAQIQLGSPPAVELLTLPDPP